MYHGEIKLDGLQSKLPKPQGWKVLIATPSVQEKTKGGLYLPEQHTDREKMATVVGLVVAVGPEAYQDKSRYINAWCKPGDWVMFRSYSGTRFKIDKQEFILVNEDTVDAVVPDPGSIVRS